MARFSLIASLLLLASCTPFPELDALVTDEARAAPPPELVPVDDILRQAEQLDPNKGEETEAELRARAAALAARANRLRQQP